MRLLRTEGQQFSILREKLLSSQPRRRISSQAVCFGPLNPQTIRKRYFSETFLDNPSSNHLQQSTQTDGFSIQRRRQDAALDKFTHFALNSQKISLGSMPEEHWMDVLDAIDAWLHMGGGFATDSAERLVERLVNEQAATLSKKRLAMNSSHSQRTMTVTDLQRDVVNAWIEAFSHGNSQLAITRAEEALFRLLDIRQMMEKTIQSEFPIQEYLAIVEGYLDFNESTKATTLVLNLTSKDNDKLNLTRRDHGALIGPILEDCATQLIALDSTTPLVTQLLETMKVLKESGICPEMTIPDATERILLESATTSHPTRNQATLKVMSPFETQVAENRLVDVLKTATKDDKDTVRGLLEKMSTPKSSVLVALVEYYLKINDSESASHWMQKLEVPILVSSNLVEGVLESWKNQSGPRIPWRADEFFRAIRSTLREHGEESSSKSFDAIVGIWNDSEDPSSNRKIIDWYSQMTCKPEATTVKMAVQALSKDNTMDDPLHIVSKDILLHWEDYTKEDKVDIANAVIKVIPFAENSTMTLSLVDKFRSENLIPDKNIFQSLLSAVPNGASPPDVLEIVHSFGKTTDLSLFVLAIDTLFKMEKDARNDIQSLYDHVMRQIVAKPDAYESDDLSEFLYSVIAMHVRRKMYPEAERCLQKAEDVLHTNTGNTLHSPIPLECYKKIIVRNWYTANTAEKAEESFEKLMKLYRGGFTNLQPDCDLYTAYIDARAVRKKDVGKTLEEMIDLYKSSGDEALKPQAKVFNTVLLSLSQDNRNEKSLSDMSINLFRRMSDLGVQPDIKTLNLILKNAIKGKSKDVYETSTMLIDLIKTKELQPDSHTLHLIIDACGSTPSEHREDALKRCLSTFGEIRKQNFVGTITYGILSKVAYRLLSRGTRADKVGESLLALCCDDGMLTSEVRGRLKSMMSRSAWERLYVGRLSTDKREPDGWNRNVQSN